MSWQFQVYYCARTLVLAVQQKQSHLPRGESNSLLDRQPEVVSSIPSFLVRLVPG